MTPAVLLALLIVLLSVAGIILALAYVLGNPRRKSKKGLRLFGAFALFYFLALYIVILRDTGFQAPIYGVMNRAGVLVLLCLLIGEIVADYWRIGKHDS